MGLLVWCELWLFYCAVRAHVTVLRANYSRLLLEHQHRAPAERDTDRTASAIKSPESEITRSFPQTAWELLVRHLFTFPSLSMGTKHSLVPSEQLVFNCRNHAEGRLGLASR